jgi:hypothetical protein
MQLLGDFLSGMLVGFIEQYNESATPFPCDLRLLVIALN